MTAKQLTWEEFESHFYPEQRDALRQRRLDKKCTGLVLIKPQNDKYTDVQLGGLYKTVEQVVALFNNETSKTAVKETAEVTGFTTEAPKKWFYKWSKSDRLEFARGLMQRPGLSKKELPPKIASKALGYRNCKVVRDDIVGYVIVNNLGVMWMQREPKGW